MKKVKLSLIQKFKFPFEGKNLSGKLILLLENARHKEVRGSVTEKYVPANEEHLQSYKNFRRSNSLGNIAAIGTDDIEGEGKAVWQPKKGIVTMGGLICIPSSEYWEAGTLFLLVKKAV